MKKTIFPALAAMCLCLAACGKADEMPASSAVSETDVTTAAPADAVADETTAEDTNPDTDDDFFFEGSSFGSPVKVTYDGTYEYDGKALKTIGDVLDIESAVVSRGSAGSLYVCAVATDSATFRAIANMPEDVEKQYYEADIFDDSYEDTITALVRDLEIAQLQDLSDRRLGSEQLEALAGKSGRELLDDGFECSGYSITEEETVFWVTKDPFEYTVHCNELLSQDEEIEDYDDAFAGLTVKSMECTGFSYMLTDVDVES
ncbi:MAG: hypothetical protein J6M90_05960 [Oscillospiraceae bacterium]|nr:hypothetical protein [Oscillospiraceae bacterium]